MKIAALAVAALVATSTACLAQGYPQIPLLSDSKTIVGEDIVYPTTGKARITAAITALAPGERTLEHQHGVPLFAYILEGELTVDYGMIGKKTYRQGQPLLEAMHVDHVGTNTGTGVVRILAVYIGAEGSQDVIPKK